MIRYGVRYATNPYTQDWEYISAHPFDNREPITELAVAEGIAAYYERQGKYVEVFEDTYVIVRTTIVYNSISGQL
jgi:hypothetical protein